jgi:hypothetical protein
MLPHKQYILVEVGEPIAERERELIKEQKPYFLGIR